ncbi:hypothetical protein ACERII_22160 [Evansella sp. AB-rgal1]|uniref:hypothetical protein n=1 Tax=Evansella sp. AB-rgal1 TaxID=3242696 RepID=UPI00359D79DE
MTAHISQWEAFMLETLVSKGISSTDLLFFLQTKDVAAIEVYDTSFEYEDLLTAYETDTENITKAVLEGYSVKFLTKLGVKKLLSLKFDLEEGTGYQVNGNVFEDVSISNSKQELLRVILSSNWKLEKEENSIRIVPIAG